MTRCEDACASGSVALYDAVYAVEAGRARVALVLGVEKMNLLDTKGVTHALATCSYWPEEGAKAVTFPCLFAEYAKGYRDRYGLSGEQLARMLASVSALCYRNGLDNPLAHFGKGGPSDRLGLVTADAILALPPEKNVVVADPLRLHDCSLITDGAAAVVIMRDEDAKKRGKAVRIAGIGHVNERMALSDRPNLHELVAGKEAVRRSFAEAGVSIADVDIAEVHDCFTINQLLTTEALGLVEGRPGGLRLPGGPVRPGRRGLLRQPLGRAQGEGPPRRRDRGVDARARLQAARRRADRGRAGREGARGRRHLQRRRLGGDQLRHRAEEDAVAADRGAVAASHDRPVCVRYIVGGNFVGVDHEPHACRPSRPSCRRAACR